MSDDEIPGVNQRPTPRVLLYGRISLSGSQPFMDCGSLLETLNPSGSSLSNKISCQYCVRSCNSRPLVVNG